MPVIRPSVPGEDKAFDASNDKIDVKSYQEIIGELLYLANRSRPDITIFYLDRTILPITI